MTTTPVQTEVPGVTTDAKPTPTLRVADRCDAGRCGAQAFVVTAHNEGKNLLLWCKHHFEDRQDDLAPFVVLDRRDALV